MSHGSLEVVLRGIVTHEDAELALEYGASPDKLELPRSWSHAGYTAWRLCGLMDMTTLDDNRLPNPHPGEILLEDFLKPMRINQSELARAIGVPPHRINEVVLGKRAVTAETDLLLTRYFGLSEGLFLRLQATYDLENARLSLGDRLIAIRPRDAA